MACRGFSGTAALWHHPQRLSAQPVPQVRCPSQTLRCCWRGGRPPDAGGASYFSRGPCSMTHRLPSLLFALALAAAPAAAQTALPRRPRRPPGPPRPAAPAARPAPVKVTSVEGITEYVLANGLRVLLFPDPTKPTITVNITYLVGSRHEDYGETGMAHLLEHLRVQGHAEAPEHPAGADGARRAAERHAPGTTAPTTSRPSRRPTRTCDWALDLEADRMVNSFIAKKDLDSEMTVVRNEFEMGENDPTGVLERARALDRVPLAQLRQVDDRRARRHRERADRPAAGLLPDVLPARQRRAARRRQVRRGEDARARQRRSSARSRSPTRTLPPTYTVEPTQDGERARRRCAASATCRRSPSRYHVPAGRASRLRPASASSPRSWPTRPRAACTRRSSRRRRPSSVGGFFLSLHDPGFLMLRGRGAAGVVARRRARPRCSRRSTPRRRSRSPRRRSSAPARACSRTST